MDDDSRVRRWETRTAYPLALASLVFLGTYAAHVLVPSWPPLVHLVLRSLQAAAWGFFVLDYAVRWRFSGEGWRFVPRHWLDTVVVVLPLMRPVRIMNAYDRMERLRGASRLPLHGRVMVYAGVSALLLGFAGALTVYDHERTAPHATILTFGDSVWFTCSTLATVGYGDVTPVTAWGRTAAVALMICGLGLLGAVTGSFSSLLVQRFARGDEDAQGPPGK